MIKVEKHLAEFATKEGNPDVRVMLDKWKENMKLNGVVWAQLRVFNPWEKDLITNTSLIKPLQDPTISVQFERYKADRNVP